MNKNWKREVLIFAIICVCIGLFELGMALLFNLDMRLPLVISFVAESAAASLIEHHLEEKERRFSN